MKRTASKLLTALLFILSCSSPGTPDPEKGKEDLKAVDIAFSDMSAEKGMKTAFEAYLDSNGILLRPDHLPITGNSAFEYLQQVNDSSFTLTWEPMGADMAASGDLGFTYGVYTLSLQDTSYKGTYVSIWKKQKDGSWKYVMDTGNEGLGQK